MSATHPISPPKTQAFDVTAPTGASVDVIIDAAASIVGKAELFSIQHLGATNFQITVSSKPAMAKIVNAEGLTIGGARVPIVPVGPQVTTVTCLFLPIYISNDTLVAALSPYGKVLEVRFGVYQDHPTIKTGTRYVRMEMRDSNPVPNFLRIAGHRATFDYRGIRRVCRRCHQEGHFKAACKTEYCNRCATFGHATEGCTTDCGRCGASHATVDCTSRRSYASAVTRQVSLNDFPALQPIPSSKQTTSATDYGRPPTTESENAEAAPNEVASPSQKAQDQVQTPTVHTITLSDSSDPVSPLLPSATDCSPQSKSLQQTEQSLLQHDLELSSEEETSSDNESDRLIMNIPPSPDNADWADRIGTPVHDYKRGHSSTTENVSSASADERDNVTKLKKPRRSAPGAAGRSKDKRDDAT
ncbi:hypothetical protein HPB47_012253 [Ixodes persulcatus]|uniref:Uncharacterized protein n=1 Tax=Ixodes persulcatus TaxID=34615 RepID=A0AC60NU40_IXOPE|nr:hypothetical protein HPB47_012253 [Ixodes persulcatus]